MNARCPTCRKPARVSVDNPYRPFCSERCKLVDLGGWLNGDYRMPVGDVESETDAPDP